MVGFTWPKLTLATFVLSLDSVVKCAWDHARWAVAARQGGTPLATVLREACSMTWTTAVVRTVERFRVAARYEAYFRRRLGWLVLMPYVEDALTVLWGSVCPFCRTDVLLLNWISGEWFCRACGAYGSSAVTLEQMLGGSADAVTEVAAAFPPRTSDTT